MVTKKKDYKTAINNDNYINDEDTLIHYLHQEGKQRFIENKSAINAVKTSMINSLCDYRKITM